MNKAFTLLELVVVIVILGVLATLGFTQYGKMVERARGAEARAIFGDIRKLAYAYRFANGSTEGFTNSYANIGTDADQIPNACASTHYFRYFVQTKGSATYVYISAVRCSEGGKAPQGTALTLLMTVNSSTGVDTWGGSGGY